MIFLMLERSKENSRSEFFQLLGIETERDETIETNAQEESTSMPEPDIKGQAKEEVRNYLYLLN